MSSSASQRNYATCRSSLSVARAAGSRLLPKNRRSKCYLDELAVLHVVTQLRGQDLLPSRLELLFVVVCNVLSDGSRRGASPILQAGNGLLDQLYVGWV